MRLELKSIKYVKFMSAERPVMRVRFMSMASSLPRRLMTAKVGQMRTTAI
jgi:hypothetical protein